MNIIMRNVEELVPYENNPRLNDKAIKKVANSIKEFGFKVPIIIDKDNVIITGHTRVLASKELGITEIPCIIAEDLTPEKIKAFRIADNKVSEFSNWDYNKLDDELMELYNSEFDLSMIGLTDLELEDFKADHKLGDYSSMVEEEDEEEFDENGEPIDVDRPNEIYQYNIVFDSRQQREEWLKYLGYLKDTYGTTETIAQRIITDLSDKINKKEDDINGN